MESKEDAGGDPDRGPLWAERTTESIATAEALAPQRAVIHNISLGADNTATERTDRTAWSVAADVLAWNSGAGRLLVVAAGNAETITDSENYPYVNLGPPHLAAASLTDLQHAFETSLHLSPQVADVMATGTFPTAIDPIVLQRVPDMMLRYGQLTRPFTITALTRG